MFQPLEVSEFGFTHASIVIAFVRFRVLEPATDTKLFVPLKLRAFPNFPDEDQVAPEIVPTFPLPD